MRRKPKDTDFLYISAWLRSQENALLSRERMERMLDARTNEEAAKVLSECGYKNLEPLSLESLTRSLEEARRETFSELARFAPDKNIVDVFRIKYDYHNLKALIKAAALGQDGTGMLIDAGRYPLDTVEAAVRSGGEETNLTSEMEEALSQAAEVLATTKDPQKSDFILDRACYAEMLATAKASRSDFLLGYVKLQIDGANLKAAVRCQRMHKDVDFLKRVLLPGGNVPEEQVISACLAGGNLENTFFGDLQQAAALGTAAIGGGRQTEFEKAVDNALGAYLKGSHMIPFGDGVLIAFAAAKENEITAARMILSGRLSGVSADAIRERLRDSYV